MNKKISIFLIILSFITISAQDKNNELLTVAIFVVGDVSAIRSDKILKVTKNFLFQAGDEIVTKKGTADIQFGPGTIIRVANNTKVKIARILEANQKQNVNLGLTKGKIFSKVSTKMAPGSSFEVSTPTMIAAVRGTEFLISEEIEESSEAGAASEIPEGVFVKEGEVAIQVTEATSEKEKVKEITAKAGEEVVVTTNGIKKQILEDYIKEKMKILDTLRVMQESNYKLMKEMKQKNQDLMDNRPGKK